MSTPVSKTRKGTAKKSTQKKTKTKPVLRETQNTSFVPSGNAKKGVSRKSGKSAEIVEVDPNKYYGIKSIGPIHLMWGKRRRKNDRGKMVKEYYIKKESKHLIWVEWSDKFEDEHEKNDKVDTTWSAEPQDILGSGSPNKKAIEEVLRAKVIWPWVTPNDEEYSARAQELKKNGYKEWKQKTGENKWKLKFGVEAQTDSTTNSDPDNSESASGTEKESDEDQDEDDEV